MAALLLFVDSLLIRCYLLVSGSVPTNIFVYADDIVLLCPSWCAMQVLLSVLEKHCVLLDLCCNIKKTVCMVFNAKDKSKVVCNNFPCFSVGGKPLQFVTEFKYLGHVITCTLSDDKDLHREICVICILEQIFLCADLVNVPRKSRLGYLGRIVYVCMVAYCTV